ncbi:hypothetical protein Hanom_Chr09g00851551 [Helianthus anomalus]
MEEFESQRTQSNPFMECEGDLDEHSGSIPNNVQVFEKVFGARRGHVRGLARKPHLSSAGSAVGPNKTTLFYDGRC